MLSPSSSKALAVSETKMVAVEVEKEVTGRLPLDVSHQLHERLVTAAKSVNHHLHQGDGVPSHTVDSLAKLGTELAQLGASTQTTADLEMLATYRSDLDAIKARLEPKWSMPYAQGGKIPFIAEYTHDGDDNGDRVHPCAGGARRRPSVVPDDPA